MILTKEQIKQLKKAHNKAKKLENDLRISEQNIASLINEFIGIEGCCDFLQGDGFGFTPESNLDTHIHVNKLIALAEEGLDITEKIILDNLSF